MEEEHNNINENLVDLHIDNKFVSLAESKIWIQITFTQFYCLMQTIKVDLNLFPNDSEVNSFANKIFLMSFRRRKLKKKIIFSIISFHFPGVITHLEHEMLEIVFKAHLN